MTDRTPHRMLAAGRAYRRHPEPVDHPSGMWADAVFADWATIRFGANGLVYVPKGDRSLTSRLVRGGAVLAFDRRAHLARASYARVGVLADPALFAAVGGANDVTLEPDAAREQPTVPVRSVAIVQASSLADARFGDRFGGLRFVPVCTPAVTRAARNAPGSRIVLYRASGANGKRGHHCAAGTLVDDEAFSRIEQRVAALTVGGIGAAGAAAMYDAGWRSSHVGTFSFRLAYELARSGGSVPAAA